MFVLQYKIITEVLCSTGKYVDICTQEHNLATDIWTMPLPKQSMSTNHKNEYPIMKRIFLSFLFVFLAMGMKAINYEEARQQAWFLTDKMAYELNLTPEQYDRAYQINLDYLMSLRSPADCSGYYWSYRDADFRCILFDWQYNLYRTLNYFYRPVRWYQARWYYPVFDRYRYGYYYYERPRVYVSYRGDMWRRRSHNDPSPYIGMRPNRGPGMRDSYHNNEWLGGGRPNGRPGYGNPGNRPSTPPTPPNNNRPGGNNNNRPNNGGRPNDRGNGGGRVDNRPNNNGGSNNTFRDSYTNYRQTGNATMPNNSGRSGGRGVGTPSNNSRTSVGGASVNSSTGRS